ncbi:single-stranded DNA-binding protein [Fictibacillus sp. 23RED33]|uniref:single-stranded DNA-binding protein n=1 Tax=Fictibacillus sp. 23RED33 TaxID=2745879 RepID=UPI0018CCE44F|nr:single-stranded DNA-binding protein [Fictibacillus sp. 23RED33]MBH0174736.1 single-stranded DNA-binding protein [Fictibacillus sp. 23RED33]
MLNRVVLVGRLTKDPELKYTPNGIAVANFILAVNRPFSNQHGEREADFIQCVVWRKPAENVANFLKKGSLAGVDGRLQTRSYENSQGQRVYVVEVMCESVQFLEPKGNNNRSQNMGQQQQQYQQQPNFNDDPFANEGNPIDISDDDLPF